MPKRHTPLRSRLGLRIRRLRERQGWGQVELAAESGLSRGNISRIENGHVEVTLSSLEALAGSFGMTVSQLLKGV